jgi:hypothetical protein
VNLVALLEGEPLRHPLDAKGRGLDAVPAGRIEREARLRDVVPEREAQKHDSRMKPRSRTIGPEETRHRFFDLRDQHLRGAARGEILFEQSGEGLLLVHAIARRERVAHRKDAHDAGGRRLRRVLRAPETLRVVPPEDGAAEAPFMTRPSKPSFRKPPGPRPSARKASP